MKKTFALVLILMSGSAISAARADDGPMERRDASRSGDTEESLLIDGALAAADRNKKYLGGRIVLAPNGSTGCSCNSPNEAWFALEPGR